MSILSSNESGYCGNQARPDNSLKSHPSPVEDPGIGYEHETSFEGHIDGLEERQTAYRASRIIGDLNLEQIPTFETVSQNRGR